MADIAPPELSGAAFGLRQSLDTARASIGPLLAIGLMWLFADITKPGALYERRDPAVA